MSIYGPSISGFEVEQAVVSTLKEWAPDYVCEIRERYSEDFPVPKMIMAMTWLEEFDHSQLPAVLVFSPGTIESESAIRTGDGVYQASWEIGVVTLVVAKTSQDSFRLARRYAEVWRMLLTQQSSLGGFAVRTEWINEMYGDRVSAGETRNVSESQFVVTVANVMNDTDGPITPIQGKDYSWPISKEVNTPIEIEARRG